MRISILINFFLVFGIYQVHCGSSKDGEAAARIGEIEKKLATIVEYLQDIKIGMSQDILDIQNSQYEIKGMLMNLPKTSAQTQAQTQPSSTGGAGARGNGAGALVSPPISGAIQRAKLTFKVSGRKFPDKDTGLGTTDGYFEVFWSDDGGNTRNKIGRSYTLSDNENPDWANEFTFDFDRSKEQLWYFKVYDEDHLRQDDNVGRVWVNVKDYVDKGQQVSVHLHKEGYLIIKSTTPQTPRDPKVPIGMIPLPPGTPTTQTLRFKVSASGLPTKDDIGFIPGNSDPYVIIYVAEGVAGTEKQIGRSATMSNTKNPNWGDVFTLQWDYKKDQRLHFKIYDDDKLRDDDKLGGGWVEVNDYVARGQALTFNTPKGGKITLSKA